MSESVMDKLVKLYIDAAVELDCFLATNKVKEQGNLLLRTCKVKYNGNTYEYKYYRLDTISEINGKKVVKQTHVKHKDEDEVKKKADEIKKYKEKLKELKSAVKECFKNIKKYIRKKLLSLDDLKNKVKSLVKRFLEADRHREEKKDNIDYEYHRILTKKGDFVRSKNELFIANVLDSLGIPYLYEQELYLRMPGNPSIPQIPDYSLPQDSGNPVYIEMLGMMDKDNYKRNWENKRELYEHNSIIMGKNLICFSSKGKSFNYSIIEAVLKNFKNNGIIPDAEVSLDF